MLLGRQAESETLDRLVDAARGGASRAQVVPVPRVLSFTGSTGVGQATQARPG